MPFLGSGPVFAAQHRAKDMDAKNAASDSTLKDMAEIRGHVVAVYAEERPEKGKKALRYAIALQPCGTLRIETYDYPAEAKSQLEPLLPYLLKTAPGVPGHSASSAMSRLPLITVTVNASKQIQKTTLWSGIVSCDNQHIPAALPPFPGDMENEAPGGANPIPGSPIKPGLNMKNFRLEHD